MSLGAVVRQRMHRVYHMIDKVSHMQTLFCLAFYIAMFAPFYAECVSQFACHALLMHEDSIYACYPLMRLCITYFQCICRISSNVVCRMSQIVKYRSPKLRHKRCRKIGRRRYKGVRSLKCSKSYGLFSRVFVTRAIVLCILLQQSTSKIAHSLIQNSSHYLVVFVAYAVSRNVDTFIRFHKWFLSHKAMNQIMHALVGNGAPQFPITGAGRGKGKGKSKGKPSSSDNSPAYISPAPQDSPYVYSDPHTEVRNAVQLALPEAARLRTQTCLIQKEWSVPIQYHQNLTKQDGIAIAPKAFLADIIRRIGYTANSVAILTVENPDHLGLAGYQREYIRCSALVMGENGVRNEVTIGRFLIQLGFGVPVTQIMTGQQVTLHSSMVKMQMRLPERFGWPTGPCPASVLAHELEQIIPKEAFAEITPRIGDTATFLVHQEFAIKLLKSSGRRCIFYKDKTNTIEYELLWLEPDTSIEDANKLADHADVFGITTKAKSGDTRFALRFQERSAMQAFAMTHKLHDQSDQGRFKLTGVDTTIGLHGVVTFLLERQWNNIEILYITDGAAIFLAGGIGDVTPAYYSLHGAKRQLIFKALNAQAREMIRSQNIQNKSDASGDTGAAASTRTTFGNFRGDNRAAAQKLFLASVGQKRNDAKIPASPIREAPKRPPQGTTGQSPPGQKARQDEL